jgi:signal transduction histidine kinase
MGPAVERQIQPDFVVALVPPEGGVTDPATTNGPTGRLDLPRSAVGTLIVLGAAGAALLLTGRREYPELHTILDTAAFLLSGVLVLLLWDMSVRIKNTLTGWLAISFAVTSLLEFIHVAISVEWSGVLAPLAQLATSLRPSTWGPAAYSLPIGVGCAVWLVRRGWQRSLGFALGLVALSAGLLVLLSWLPKYVSPEWMGIARPTLIPVPLLWVAVGWACWRRRARERLLPKLAVMAAVLCVAHVAMLYSRAADDTPAMVAHLGKVAGRLFLLLSLMQMASSDMLARIRAERRLAALNEELEGRVRDRTERLHASNTSLEAEIVVRRQVEDELRRSNEELERFAYVASHDLQEPLRMVGSYVQLLGKRYRGRLDADADEFIAYALDGALRMQRLIEDLLAYSRVGTRGAAFVSTDANAALDGALANLGLAIQESGASVTSERLPIVQADPGQLEHLFLNLISNALKFRGAEPPRVRVSVVRQGREWHFSIQDNGVGIEPQYFERIFVIFQRLHGREKYQGTGIGLAVAKKIVERHGGRIWVESTPDQGATFHFTLQAEKEG